MLKKVATSVALAGCYLQAADAFVVGSAQLARATPALRATSSVRPRRDSLCTVNMGVFLSPNVCDSSSVWRRQYVPHGDDRSRRIFSASTCRLCCPGMQLTAGLSAGCSQRPDVKKSIMPQFDYPLRVPLDAR